jgi:hypothetical protein
MSAVTSMGKSVTGRASANHNIRSCMSRRLLGRYAHELTYPMETDGDGED